MWFGLGFAIAAAASIPFLFSRQFIMFVIATVVEGLLLGWAFWANCPGAYGPFFGVYGGALVVLLGINGGIALMLSQDGGSEKAGASSGLVLAGIGLIAMLITTIGGCEMGRSKDYASLIGPVEQRQWNMDLQVKDPTHLRLVNPQAAAFLADKALQNSNNGSAVIGSQFEINRSMAAQLIHGEVWYCGELDFKGFSEWQSAQVSPGFVMVSGEDPYRDAIFRSNEKFRYTPRASFQYKLVRHLRENGYLNTGLLDITLEVDELGKPWWVVTTYKPTIAWGGEKVTGVIICDPVTGGAKFYPLGSVPHWADRIIPGFLVQKYADYLGKYSNGWLNTWWGKKDLQMPEWPGLNEGADGEPYWCVPMTSRNEGDQSLVGYLFVHTRTGQAVFYRVARGSTDESIMGTIETTAKAQRMTVHCGYPVVYNIYGQLTAICQLMGENNSHQGIGICCVTDVNKVVVAKTITDAYRRYQSVLARQGSNVAPELERNQQELTGIVDRFAQINGADGSTWEIHVNNVPHLFTGDVQVSTKLPVTKIGDRVRIKYTASGEDVVPMLQFDNLSLTLVKTANQDTLVQQNELHGQQDAEARENTSAVQGLENMTPEQQAEAFRLLQAKQAAKK